MGSSSFNFLKNSQKHLFLRLLNHRRIHDNLILRASSTNNSKNVDLTLKPRNIFMQKFTCTENIYVNTEQKTPENSAVKNERVLATEAAVSRSSSK